MNHSSERFGRLTWAAWCRTSGGPWRLLGAGASRAEALAKVPRDHRGEVYIAPAAQLPVVRRAGQGEKACG
jgi:hypothetical protein